MGRGIVSDVISLKKFLNHIRHLFLFEVFKVPFTSNPALLFEIVSGVIFLRKFLKCHQEVLNPAGL